MRAGCAGVAADARDSACAVMMRPANERLAVYVCIEPVDFRKQINGLAALVQEDLGLDPFSEQLFVFTNRRRDRCKVIYWERSGFVLWLKRLERERFAWPKHDGKDVVTLTAEQLNWLLDGYDLSRMKPHARLAYSAVV